MKKKITPPSSAVALKYEGTGAPKVTAKGRGDVAENIIEIAQQHDVFLHQDPELSKVLTTLDLGEEIPESLYVAIAEVLSFVYQLDGNQIVKN